MTSYAIIIFLLFMLWCINYYGVIGRIDTYFTTGNMMRIAEAKALYKDNSAVLLVLDEMLENEVKHKTITEEYLSIFDLKMNPDNGRVRLIETLTSAGVFVIIFIPMTIYTGIKDYLKGKTIFVVELLTVMTILASIFAIIWVSQWFTSQIPSIWGCSMCNYILNIAFQIAVLYMVIKHVSMRHKNTESKR